MAVTNGLVLPIPELTDTADGPDAISDLANAVEDYFFDRILPPGVTRWSTFHWGSGASFPTAAQGAKVGDLYYHTGLACTMRAINPGATTPVWRQAEPSIVANKTARDAISINYTGLLYEGFEIIVQTVTGPPVVAGSKYRWTGSAWDVLDNLPRAVVLRTTASTVAGSAETPITWSSLSTRSTASMWAAAAPTRLVAPETGEYDLSALINWQVSANPGGLGIGFRVNGGNTIWMDLRPSQAYYFNAISAAFRGLILLANDYVEFFVMQNSDSNRGLQVGALIANNPQFYAMASITLARR